MKTRQLAETRLEEAHQIGSQTACIHHLANTQSYTNKYIIIRIPCHTLSYRTVIHFHINYTIMRIHYHTLPYTLQRISTIIYRFYIHYQIRNHKFSIHCQADSSAYTISLSETLSYEFTINYTSIVHYQTLSREAIIPKSIPVIQRSERAEWNSVHHGEE